jgi:hypothetical protein
VRGECGGSGNADWDRSEKLNSSIIMEGNGGEGEQIAIEVGN